MLCFARPLDEIALADLQELVENRIPESDRLEYKRGIPAKRGTSPRPGAINNYAKKAICEKVVSFSNAAGGIYLIGVEEKASASSPPVAAKLVGIPHHREIVEKLKNIFYTSIEPQVNVEIASIPIDDDLEQQGVVLVRIASSVRRPHAFRFDSSFTFPIRRGDQTQKMNIHEVQDMVMRTAAWQELLEKRIARRSLLFQKNFQRVRLPTDSYGIRLSAMPVSNEIQLSPPLINGRILADPYEKPTVRVSYRDSQGHEHKMQPLGETYISLNWSGKRALWHPILRGAQLECADRGDASSPFSSPIAGRYAYQEFHQDGLVEMGYIAITQLADGSLEDLHGWGLYFLDNVPITMIAELSEWTRALRSCARAPNAEYLIDVEFCIEGNVDDQGRGKTKLAAIDDSRLDVLVAEVSRGS